MSDYNEKLSFETDKLSFEEPLLESQEPEPVQVKSRSCSSSRVICAVVAVLALIATLAMVTFMTGFLKMAEDCHENDDFKNDGSFTFGDMSDTPRGDGVMSDFHFAYQGDDDVSATACLDFQPPNNYPRFKYWPKDDVSFSEMVHTVYEGALKAWTDQDYSLTRLSLTTDLFLRLTESNAGEIEAASYPHLDEAVHMAIQTIGADMPNAECAFGHDSRGNKVAFVWGYDKDLVEQMECKTGGVEKFCLKVDNEYFKHYQKDE